MFIYVHSTQLVLDSLMQGVVMCFPCMFVCSRCNGMLHSNISLTGPSRVTGVSVTKSLADGNFTLTVSWTTPQSESPITKYEVDYRTSDTESWINSTRLSVSPPANSTILTGLDAGVEYIVRVRAMSEIAGDWSTVQTTVTVVCECLWSIADIKRIYKLKQFCCIISLFLTLLLLKLYCYSIGFHRKV